MHLFLSPHFDDAVLSCGGTIHRLAGLGEAVSVLTIMGSGLPETVPDTPIIRDLHRRWEAGHDPLAARKQEDITALKSLGASAQHLNIHDCVYRVADGVALYPSEESLWGDIHPDDPALNILKQITPANMEQTKRVYVPLGVGHHVDHRIIRDWGLELVKRYPDIDFLFYEEYPYTKDIPAINRALNAFITAMNRHDVRLTEADIKAKIQAVGCYRSQISTFWESVEDMARDIRASLARDAGGEPVERYRRMARQDEG